MDCPLYSYRWARMAGAFVAAVSLLGMTLASVIAAPVDELEKGFLAPPDSAKPHTWWHWMNGNVTKEGISADIAAMKRVGLGGAQVFNASCGIPAGSVKLMTPEWYELMAHAAREAARQDFELCFHNCPGWSSSGGPWITPEYGMQILTSSKVQVQGPAEFAGVLPQPPKRLDFYRDIAVLAFRTSVGDEVPFAERAPVVSASDAGFEGAKVCDGNLQTLAGLRTPKPGKPAYVQFEFKEPMAWRALTLTMGAGRNGHAGEIQVSDDGQTFKTVRPFYIQSPQIGTCFVTLRFEPTPARYYRVAFTRADGESRRITVAEIEFHAGARIENVAGKAGYMRSAAFEPARDVKLDPSVVLAKTEVVDLTQSLQADGSLRWNAPEGNWTILRLGHTPTGKTNHPAPKAGEGLECDKLSREAFDAHWDGGMKRIVDEGGPAALGGKGFTQTIIDSYEVGCQNWTPRFREEFVKRRGYDLFPYLPTMAGYVVDSVEVSERFLWDVRRTLADLFADNYFGRCKELCEKNGMKLYIEPYGSGNFDEITSGSRADIPMTEFWSGGGFSAGGGKLASSVAHLYGRQYVAAESFTADYNNGKWQNHPYRLKAIGDFEYCAGINRFVFHRYAQQPWLDKEPGMTMGPWGFHFERTETWWNEAPAWTTYLARCQYLLQSGLYVADVCVFVGENSPCGSAGRGALPEGYEYDACDAQAILTRMAVKDGKIVLPDGMNYRFLVLPRSETMTPETLRKVRDLVKDGATVVGTPPSFSPSLTNFPTCDAEVGALTAEVWGDRAAAAAPDAKGEHVLGKGRVIWGTPFAAILAAAKLPPDFSYSPSTARINWIHRVCGDADVYFVANQNTRYEEVTCSFRGVGRQPEFWRADRGAVEPVAVWHEADGCTAIPIRFDPAGSVFVVFRGKAAGDHPVAVTHEGPVAEQPKPKVSWLLIKAVYGAFEQSVLTYADVTAKVAAMVKGNALTVGANNDLAADPDPNVIKELRVEYTVGGESRTKHATEGGTLTIADEGKPLVITRARYGTITDELPVATTVDVTEKLKAMVKDGVLAVQVSNSIAGDPAPMVVKELRVEYEVDGMRKSRVVRENDILRLPDEAPDLAALPVCEVDALPAGVAVTAWEQGTYTLPLASGETAVVSVERVPAPLEVSGPWEVRFQPNRGAPEKVVFDRLMSWPDHNDAGVKYFSGAATYAKSVTFPADMIAKDRRLYLDLGTVAVIAQVKLNDKDLGIQWKPPFRIEITDVVRPGENALEVRVVNLWPNRLIGDAQLPEDCEWRGDNSLKEWPKWLVDNTPRTSGRITFTTWNHWKKDSPLLDSGLLGPVLIRAAERRWVKGK
ncbi:MAG: hypothetical protein A3K19_26980 [Lentisphaerae bacterium RIFOXYB12_FULL_65_16]|nr:MAG: hypothetical protein A3K18_28165 [Lentisphaerae bacterium RIFOXYA12_64_32]OGV88048.1 MAG: hypothetical protein A3K19_26980 [Lentisphaerae bacterium RIFOXYB12_FULL_65_16]